MRFKKLIASVAAGSILSISMFAQAATFYIVRQGDTCTGIAKRYGLKWSDLQKANPHIKNPASVKPGQKITIPDSSTVSNSYENQVVTLVNKERAKRGLTQLKINATLAKVARLKSSDMATKNYFSHTSPTYGSPFTMMQHYGIRFSAAGENIAMGQPTPEAVMNAWMNSPGHRSNILSPTYNQIGVGYVKNSKGVAYWTQEFIKSM